MSRDHAAESLPRRAFDARGENKPGSCLQPRGGLRGHPGDRSASPERVKTPMDRIAQTNLQLYAQLLDQSRSGEELSLVHKAYQLACVLYSGHYQGDGKPFVCHSVGVASILAHLGFPAEFIAVGLIHNIFCNGDFGDDRRDAVTADRRNLVCRAVGNEVAALTERFHQFRVSAETIDAIANGLSELDGVGRHLLVVDLADILEKYVDFGVLYFGDAGWIEQAVDNYGDRLIDIAGRLGHPTLAAMLEDAFRPTTGRRKVPDALRQTDRAHLDLFVPLSCRRRRWPMVRERLRRRWHWIRRRTSFKRIALKIRKLAWT